jgi:DNA-binding GntR family transcriptional regulator
MLRELAPIAKQSMESRVVDSLRSFVLSGAVTPGTRLTEIALAEQLGIARATLRAGLTQLAADGIIVRIPYKGWQVATLTANDVWEIWTLRGALESLGARIVAQAIGESPAEKGESPAEEVERRFGALQASCEVGDMGLVSDADFCLHHSIVELSEHRQLLRQYDLVEQRVRLFIATSNAFVSEGPEDIIGQHRPVVEAILAGDGDQSALQASLHNEREGARLSSWLSRSQIEGSVGVR